MTEREKITAYLDRIGFTGAATVSAQTLATLQRLHLRAVPYENLDIMRNIPLSLAPDALFEKIVLRKRGGYCFELNGLFAWLLRAMGFTVTEYLSRFLKDEPQGVPMRRHRVLRVTAGGQHFLADVGVGGRAPQQPLPLICGPVSVQNNEKYKLERDPFLGYILYEWRDNAWGRLYAFTEEAQADIDFVMPSFWCEAHPDSPFRAMDMVHIFTENGRKSVAGREVRLFSPQGVEVLTPTTEAAYAQLLRQHFGLDLDRTL